MQLGRYTVLGRLAMGGMAEVLLAQLSGTSGFEKRVIIKRVLPQYAAHPEFLRLFEQEARFASFLVHPHIAQVFDFGVDASGAAYLVMEFIDGASLRTLLTTAQQRGEQTDVRLVCRIFSQVAEALAAVHAAVDPGTRQPLDLVHRDVSPENVLLSRQGAVKLADFGIARAMNEVSTTQPDVIRGKLRYLAPEQVVGEPLSPAIDVWALGVSLYEALALRRPFPEDNEGQTVHAIVNLDFPPLEAVRPDLPAELVNVVKRCLRRQPGARYPDCQDLALELERLASSGSGGVTARIVGNWVDRLVPQDPVVRALSGQHPALQPAAQLTRDAPDALEGLRTLETPLGSTGLHATPSGRAVPAIVPPPGAARPERSADAPAHAEPPLELGNAGGEDGASGARAGATWSEHELDTSGGKRGVDPRHVPAASGAEFRTSAGREGALDPRRTGAAALRSAEPATSGAAEEALDPRRTGAAALRSADPGTSGAGEGALAPRRTASTLRSAEPGTSAALLSAELGTSAAGEGALDPRRAGAPSWSALSAADGDAPVNPAPVPQPGEAEDERAPRSARRWSRPLAALAVLVVLSGAGFWFKDRLPLPRMRSSAVRAIIVTSTPPGATVRQGTTVLGTTPWAGDVSTSTVELSIDAPGYQAQRGTLAPGDSSLNVVLKRSR